MTQVCPHLPWSTLGPVQRWTFLGLTEERVVVFAAPQLFTGFIVRVLETNTQRYLEQFRTVNHKDQVHSEGKETKTQILAPSV